MDSFQDLLKIYHFSLAIQERFCELLNKIIPSKDVDVDVDVMLCGGVDGTDVVGFGAGTVDDGTVDGTDGFDGVGFGWRLINQLKW